MVVLLYLAVLAFNEIRGRRHRAAPAQSAVEVAAPAKPVEPAPVESVAPAEAVPPVAGDILSFKEAMVLVKDGAADRDAGRMEAAEQRLRRALELAPDLTAGHRELAHLLERKKEYPDAAAEWRAVLSREPDNVPARIRLASVLMANNQPANALDAIRWALEGEPYSEEGHELAAAAFTALQQPREAIVHLRRLVTINRDDLVAQNNLGVAFLAVADYRNALLTFQEVLRADAGNSVAFYNLAVCYARQTAVQDSVDTLKQAARKFGMPFVLSWTQSGDFDPIRQDAAFRAFVAQSQGVASAPTNDAAEPASSADAASAPDSTAP